MDGPPMLSSSESTSVVAMSAYMRDFPALPVIWLFSAAAPDNVKHRFCCGVYTITYDIVNGAQPMAALRARHVYIPSMAIAVLTWLIADAPVWSTSR